MAKKKKERCMALVYELLEMDKPEEGDELLVVTPPQSSVDPLGGAPFHGK